MRLFVTLSVNTVHPGAVGRKPPLRYRRNSQLLRMDRYKVNEASDVRRHGKENKETSTRAKMNQYT